MIPVSVIITTKNESVNLPHSLPPLAARCAEIFVVDSDEHDIATRDIVNRHGAIYVPYQWNGAYPKKRQWCLDHLPITHDFVLFIDADEIGDDVFFNELSALDFQCDGYFISSKMVWRGVTLHHGIRNNKLCLIHRDKFCFPVIDDLDIAGMGEIEGHYQPVAVDDRPVTIGRIKTPLLHHDRRGSWQFRHDNYAKWEAAMNKRNAWPVDPVPYRQFLKKSLRHMTHLRPAIMFLYAYIIKGGFWDSYMGFDYALARARYARRIGLMMKVKNQVNNHVDNEQSAGQHHQ